MLETFPVSQPKQPADILEGEPIERGMIGRKAERAHHRQDRPPQIAMKIENEPSGACGYVTQTFEYRLHIGREVHSLGEDDVVERPIERQVLARLRVEDALWKPLASSFDLARRNIHSRDIGIGQQAEQFAAATSDLQHAGVGRDEVTVIVRQKPPVMEAEPIRVDRGRIVETTKTFQIPDGWRFWICRSCDCSRRDSPTLHYSQL